MNQLQLQVKVFGQQMLQTSKRNCILDLVPSRGGFFPLSCSSESKSCVQAYVYRGLRRVSGTCISDCVHYKDWNAVKVGLPKIIGKESNML